MLRRITIAVTAILLPASAARCQTTDAAYSPQAMIEQMMEYAAESDNGSDADIENTLINSEYLLMNAMQPIDINTENQSQLMQVPSMSEIQANRIHEYRSQYGNIGSVAELKTILNTNDDMIKLMQPFITADTTGQRHNASLRELMRSGQHSISTNTKTVLEKQNGYQPDSSGQRYYQGSPASCCIRYRYMAGNRIAMGITMGKDAGESIGFGKQKYGFDFNSGYIRIDGPGRINRLIIGDMKASFGQGLMLGGGLCMGKAASGMLMTPSGNFIREYGSTNESNFVRGAGASARFGNTSITAFAGANLADASCDSKTTFHSIKTDGMHRTNTELMRKDNIRENRAGIIVSHTTHDFRIGAAAHYIEFDKTLMPGPEIRNACMRPMRKALEASVSYQYQGDKISAYGETAMDGARHLATINSIDIDPASGIRISLMHRRYSKQYQALKASSYTQGPRVANEEGIYAGLMLRLNDKISANAWADIYRMPWLGYRINEPTAGHECATSANFLISKTASLQIRCKAKSRQTSDSGRISSGYIKATLSYSPVPGTRLSTAAQWSRYRSSQGTERGYLVHQNAQYTSRNGAISAAARLAIFSAPYNARIYSYENDVSLMMAAPGYFYTGIRYYLMLGTCILRNVRLQARISQWRYSNRSQISSGRQMIDSNHKTELSIYAQYKF